MAEQTPTPKYQHNLKLQAPNDRMLHIWVEPWGDGLGFPPGTTIELRAISSIEGELQLDSTPKRTAIYGWGGSTLQVLVEGQVIYSFEPAVPLFVTKEQVTMLFGEPPTPTPEEGAFIQKKPWWQFWSK